MTRLDLFRIWSKLVSDAQFQTRMGQLFALLTPTEQTAVIANMKSDALTILNGHRDSTNTRFTAEILSQDGAISDVDGVS